jgi:thymidine phosphorylase
MLVIGRIARDIAAGTRRIEDAISSGAGFDRLRLAVRLQGGDVRVIDDPGRLPRARHEKVVRAARAGVLTRVDAGRLGRAATLLGAGRLRKEDAISPGVGIVLHAKVGARVGRGDRLCTLCFDDPARARAIGRDVEAAFVLGGRPPGRIPLVLETLQS